MDKRQLTEQEIRTRFITPALLQAGWDSHQIREEVYFTAGRIIVRGNLSLRSQQRKFADYLLYYKPDIPLALVEAKDNNHQLSAGMDQALEYADLLDVPFVYTSNGDGFMEHDRTRTGGPVERRLSLDEFPAPEQLWQRYTKQRTMSEPLATAAATDYYFDRNAKQLRYYQRVAIQRTVEAIARGDKRILLVMATGTGKTFTAFHIIWRLWRARTVRRILFLADRNILIDQTMTNDFKHFGDKMTKIVHRQVDKSFEVYLALYQGISGTEEWQDIYRQFSPDFFGLVVVDECHRGSAAADSAWREVLEYFTSATQLGMTATPKETSAVSNIDYFGEPIYTYSLRQGIEDGFLAPYKVIRIDLDRDIAGWRPDPGQLDRYGAAIPDELYTSRDFDRTLVIDERTQLVAWRISEYLKVTNRFQKTIVFCEDIDHAERMRHAIANFNGDLVHENRRYVMRITGDNPVGKAELDNFINPEERYPVIATTSKLMTTGVDAQTCQLIVLDQTINSMTEFKQIIGRGTRIREEFGKTYFTIIDFRNATHLFADPAFDGEPVQIYQPGPGDPPVPPDVGGEAESPTSYPPLDEEPTAAPFRTGERPGQRDKYYVSGVEFTIQNERVHYLDKSGNLQTVSFKDFSRENLRRHYASLDDFLARWNQAERKAVILEELLEQGFLLEELTAQLDGELDPFDLICYIAFDRPPLTRSQRARSARQSAFFDQLGEGARRVLEALLDKYANEGIDQNEGLFPLPPLAEQRRIVAKVDQLFAQTRPLAAKLRRAQEEIVVVNRAALHRLHTAEHDDAFQSAWRTLADHFDLLYDDPRTVADLRQAILDLAVRGKLVPQDPHDEPASELLKRVEMERNALLVGMIVDEQYFQIEIPDEMSFALPSGWALCRLDTLLLKIEAGRSFAAQSYPAEKGEYGVLKVSAVTWGTFLPDQNKALFPGSEINTAFAVKAGDVLITRANTADLVGAVVLVEQDFPNLLLSDKTLRLEFTAEAVFRPFILYALRSPWVRSYFAANASGTSSSMRNLSQEKIRGAPIALPPLAEQRRIVAKVDHLMRLCDELEARLRQGHEQGRRLAAAVLQQVG